VLISLKHLKMSKKNQYLAKLFWKNLSFLRFQI